MACGPFDKFFGKKAEKKDYFRAFFMVHWVLEN